MGVRKEVADFVAMGPLPAEDDPASDEHDLQRREHALKAIRPPVNEDEAVALLECFGPDNCFGLAWTLLHLIETAPDTPVHFKPPEPANEWVRGLWERWQRGKKR